MLLSLGLIFIFGILFSYIFEKIKLPRILGMLFAGILLGPYVFNVLDKEILDISNDLRKIALIIILARVGFNLDIKSLKSIGRAAFLMCFLPAVFEIIGMVILGTTFFKISIIDSLIMGSVLAAVSPAIIVPRMFKLIDEGYGKDKSIPQMIMAGASIDDIFVIILFTIFTHIAQSGEFNFSTLLSLPLCVLISVFVGILFGIIIINAFKKININESIKVILILSTGCLFVGFEHLLPKTIPFSGVLAIMIVGMIMRKKDESISKNISSRLSQLWVGAEILLFVLVGATVNVKYVLNSGFLPIFVILGVLVFRCIGVFLSLIKTNFTFKEKIFVVFSYLPKATVQAAIGGLPLAMGLNSGELILTIAVLSIIITAPLGAILIDSFYKRLLRNGDNND